MLSFLCNYLYLKKHVYYEMLLMNYVMMIKAQHIQELSVSTDALLYWCHVLNRHVDTEHLVAYFP